MTTSVQDEVVTGPKAETHTPAATTSPSSETLVARVAIGLVALHVADDSFLQPEPGTSAADHLVSGLVPLAVLVLAAWAYPRLRAGARASIALVLGLFGITAGIEAVYYGTSDAGLSGDDYTGLLSLIAGVVLLGVGVVTLWRTRRRDDSRRRRYLRRVLLALGGFLVLVLLIAPFFTGYVLTHTARAFVPEPELGAAHEEVSFTTSDGLVLRGWYIPSRNGAAVIAFPGRKGSQRPARMLARHGYGVLLFDRRGEGESDGDPNIFGWNGERDVHAAVEFLEGRPDVEPGRIGGIGLSVGGEMMIEAAAESDGLKALVSDGAGIRSLREALAVPETGMRAQGVLVHAVLTPSVALFSNTFPPPSLEDLSARISAPVLFIYADPGQGGEAELTQAYYDAAPEPKEVWLVPGAEHTGGIEAQPEEYERRVVGFFDEALLGGH
jgi:dienelactone hydrolase